MLIVLVAGRWVQAQVIPSDHSASSLAGGGGGNIAAFQ